MKQACLFLPLDADFGNLDDFFVPWLPGIVSLGPTRWGGVCGLRSKNEFPSFLIASVAAARKNAYWG